MNIYFSFLDIKHERENTEGSYLDLHMILYNLQLNPSFSSFLSSVSVQLLFLPDLHTAGVFER